MDVHPPLAKMLIALTGWLAGFDGNFDFKEIGKDYIEPGVPYVAMRLYPAVCGIILAPFMFLTLKTIGCRTFTAAMGASFIIFGMFAIDRRLAPKVHIDLPISFYRERPPHSGSIDPPRLASRIRHRVHCARLFLLHQPA